jgi:hypothetical protein
MKASFPGPECRLPRMSTRVRRTGGIAQPLLLAAQALRVAKVFALQDLIRDGTADDGLLLWMDSDAYLGPADPRELAKSDPTASFWVSPDAPPLFHAPCPGTPAMRAEGPAPSARERSSCARTQTCHGRSYTTGAWAQRGDG